MTIADHLRLASFDPGAQGAEIGVDLVTRTLLTQSEAKDKHKHKHSSIVVLSLYQLFEICNKSHGNTFATLPTRKNCPCKKTAAAQVPSLFNKTATGWAIVQLLLLSNCATALAHRSIIPRASALRPRALSAPSESDLQSLVCISVMEIACRARTVQSSLARRASVARNLQHVALAAKLQLTRRFWLCCGPVICARKEKIWWEALSNPVSFKARSSLEESGDWLKSSEEACSWGAALIE